MCVGIYTLQIGDFVAKANQEHNRRRIIPFSHIYEIIIDFQLGSCIKYFIVLWTDN